MKRRKRGTRAAEFALLSAALVLFAYGAHASSLSSRVPLMVGSAVVGISASVAPNQDNTLAAQLAAKEAELAAREAALQSRDSSGNPADSRALYSFAASAILFGLLGLNYFLDWRRSRVRPMAAA